jgi:hypothetical protein
MRQTGKCRTAPPISCDSAKMLAKTTVTDINRSPKRKPSDRWGAIIYTFMNARKSAFNQGNGFAPEDLPGINVRMK